MEHTHLADAARHHLTRRPRAVCGSSNPELGAATLSRVVRDSNHDAVPLFSPTS